MSNDTTKICKRCGNIYPATKDYFHAHKRMQDGLNAWCKICVHEYYQATRDKKSEYNREYKKVNKDTIDEYNRTYYQTNKDREQKRVREYYYTNQDKIRRYYQANKDRFIKYHQVNRNKRLMQMSKYWWTNRDKLLKKGREYRLTNRDNKRIKDREYRQANPEKIRIYGSRREARRRSLPDTFTSEQWAICLAYFDYACAVCGVSFEDAKSHADHWIPLTSDECTGTIASNMVCLCSHCNLTKNAKLPEIWLKERYEVAEVNEILARIEAYFEWVNHS